MNDELPYAHGGPPLRARLRSTPEDFRVTELPAFAADGRGEHVLLTVRKRGANTDWVARELARFADVSGTAIGYAGLKDRHAVTEQTFSVQLAGREEPDWAAFPHPEVQVLASARHSRKLKRGALAGNRFVLVLRDVEGEREAAERVLAAITTRGVPNYFGEQRFGRGGGNVERAKAMFGGRRVDRKTRSLLLSAARSHLFNTLLAGRVEDDCWDRPLDGEIWNLAGSRSWFGPEAFDETLAERLASGDIHPSGPLWGRGDTPATADAAERERTVAATEPELVAGLAETGMDQERRSLRLIPREFEWLWMDDGALQVSFALPPGCYATVVMRELARS